MDGPSQECGSRGDDDARKHARAQHNALERRRRDNIKVKIAYKIVIKLLWVLHLGFRLQRGRTCLHRDFTN